MEEEQALKPKIKEEVDAPIFEIGAIIETEIETK